MDPARLQTSFRQENSGPMRQRPVQQGRTGFPVRRYRNVFSL